MLTFFKKKRLNKFIEDVRLYISSNYIPQDEPPTIKYSLEINVEKKQEKKENPEASIRYSDRVPPQEPPQNTMISNERHSKKSAPKPLDEGIKYSKKIVTKKEDPYNATDVAQLLRAYSASNNFDEAIKNLEKNVNQTFVDKLLHYINKKGVRDSQVYKAAQVDKRLYSKIISNRQYKPSKDTAIALALALELSLDEAIDILSRAGYTFSHSSMRDVIIEYFFREKLYNMMDLNYVLYSYHQKLIGRS